MSTKIYDGYLIQDNLNEIIQKLTLNKTFIAREMLLPFYLLFYRQEKITLIEGRKERKMKEQHPLFDFYNLKINKIAFFFKEKFNDYVNYQEESDFDNFKENVFIKILIYPYEINKGYLCRIVSNLINHEIVFEKLKEIINIQPYAYFNNIDKPDKISNKEWQKRMEHWNNVMIKNYLIIDLLDYNFEKNYCHPIMIDYDEENYCEKINDGNDFIFHPNKEFYKKAISISYEFKLNNNIIDEVIDFCIKNKEKILNNFKRENYSYKLAIDLDSFIQKIIKNENIDMSCYQFNYLLLKMTELTIQNNKDLKKYKEKIKENK